MTNHEAHKKQGLTRRQGHWFNGFVIFVLLTGFIACLHAAGCLGGN